MFSIVEATAAVVLVLLVAVALGSPVVRPTTPTRSSPPRPPVWPLVWSAQFAESLYINGSIVARDQGAWHYDYARGRARFDHGTGEANNFCACAMEAGKSTSAGCQLLFTADGLMRVVFPELDICCILCDAADGCGVLVPDWLKNGTFQGVGVFNGTTCSTFATPGAVAIDSFSTAVGNGDAFLPCQYKETIDAIGMVHYLDFRADTFSTAPEPDKVFAVPSGGCTRHCPRQFPSSRCE